jgi:hypothetical protein
VKSPRAARHHRREHHKPAAAKPAPATAKPSPAPIRLSVPAVRHAASTAVKKSNELDAKLFALAALALLLLAVASASFTRLAIHADPSRPRRTEW